MHATQNTPSRYCVLNIHTLHIYMYIQYAIYIYICACNICVDIRDHWCAEDALATVVFRRPLWRPFRGCRRSGWGLRHRVPLGVGHSEELRTQMATWVAGWLAAGEDFTWGGFSDHLGPYCQPICLHYRIYRLPPWGKASFEGSCPATAQHETSKTTWPVCKEFLFLLVLFLHHFHAPHSFCQMILALEVRQLLSIQSTSCLASHGV